MGCCDQAAVSLGSAALNPALHVNYAKGMVLGVDDFQQEFAYHDGRDQWARRELVGYGTTSGLAVTVDDTSEGPRVRVSAGSAVLPDGQLVRVPAEQCALVAKWLARPETAAAIAGLLTAGTLGAPLLSPPASPPATHLRLPLYLSLRYSSCATLPVPIPGDPCRSEDLLMAPSRVADDYTLELATQAPAQAEEDALRAFVAWLRRQIAPWSIPPSPRDEATLAAALAAAFRPYLEAVDSGRNLLPLPQALAGSPPIAVPVSPPETAAFLRAALRLWVTRLRPASMACGCGTGATGTGPALLLARIVTPIAWVAGQPSGHWQMDGKAADMLIDESQRPLLLHQRLLQQWQLAAAQP